MEMEVGVPLSILTPMWPQRDRTAAGPYPVTDKLTAQKNVFVGVI